MSHPNPWRGDWAVLNMKSNAEVASLTADVNLSDFQEAQRYVAEHAYRTPLLTSRLLSALTDFDVRVKAEMFQRTGSYKLRGPLNKFRHLTSRERQQGVVCSSAGNHAQGVALAASIYKIRAAVVMATNATPSKVEATRGYGAEVIQHGTIYEEFPEVEIVIVPIGGGGLISGVSMALKACNPKIRVIGVESSGAPGMRK